MEDCAAKFAFMKFWGWKVISLWGGGGGGGGGGGFPCTPSLGLITANSLTIAVNDCSTLVSLLLVGTQFS